MNKHKYKTFIIGLLAVVLLAVPGAAHALNADYPSVPLPGGDIDLNCLEGVSDENCEGEIIPLTLANLIRFLFAAALWIGGLVAFGALLYVGYTYLISGASPGQYTKAREGFKGVMWGIGILLLSVILLNTINPDTIDISDVEIETLGIGNPTSTPPGYTPVSSPGGTAPPTHPIEPVTPTENISCRERCLRDNGTQECSALPSCDEIRTCPMSHDSVELWQGWGACRGSNCQRSHKGYDIGANYRVPVVATESGVVTRTSPTGKCGKRIYLGGKSGITYLYCHLDQIDVDVGDEVLVGDVIGHNGKTGNAATTPPHVHFEYIEEAMATNNTRHSPKVDHYVEDIACEEYSG